MAEDRERLTVLPCVNSLMHAGTHASRLAAPELKLLPVSSPAALLFRVQTDNPDVIFIAEGEAFLDVLRRTRGLERVFAETPAVLLAAEPGPSLVRKSARFHIHSVIPSVSTPRQLAAAITAAAAGFAVTTPRLPSPGVESIGESEHLTARELEVLRLMARGHRNKQVAELLHISEHTAKFHVSSVMAKLAARTRTEAVTIGVMRGLVAI